MEGAIIPVKPEVSEADALLVLDTVFPSPATRLTATQDGQIAQTFSFVVQDREHFLQFNHANMAQADKTETHFQEQFRLHAVPVRRVVAKGVVRELHYTISEKVPGVPLASLSSDDFLLALPGVLDQLGKIAKVDTTGTTGYGWLNEACNGKFDSWLGHLLGIWNEDPGDFYGLWHQFFTSTFLEKDKFEQYYSLMKSLLPSVPDSRNLVHGDFGYGNVFVQGGEVSAILDWQNCRFGDPAFDLAGMLFWRESEVAATIFGLYRDRAEAGDFLAAHLNDRVKCYLLYLGLDGLRYSARTENRGMYDYVLTILEKVAQDRHH